MFSYFRDLKLVFMGTPEFAVPCLEALIPDDWNIAAVVTNPDKPVGRKKILTPPPVKIAAQKRGLLVFQPENLKNQEIAEQIRNLKPDLLIICAYGKIIPKAILEIPKYGTINIHASLLPRWRGPSPIQFAILNGDKETGITIMAVNEKMDEGGVYSHEIIPIEASDDAETLAAKLSVLGANLLVKTLPKIISGELKARPQAEFIGDWGEPSYCKILKKTDGKIDWNKPAREIERQIRAFIKEPGSFTIFNRAGIPLEIKILKAEAMICPDNAEIENEKTFLIEKNGIGVKTGEGCLEILRIQPQGKNPMEVKNFLNGYPDFIGAVLK